MGVSTMSLFRPRGRSPFPRAAGLLDSRCAGALCATLLALLLLSHLLGRPPAEQPLDAAGWTGAQLLDHLQRRGVQLRVVRGASHGGPCDNVFLTEDPEATWATL